MILCQRKRKRQRRKLVGKDEKGQKKQKRTEEEGKEQTKQFNFKPILHCAY